MVNGIGSQSANLAQVQQLKGKMPSAEDMFAKLSEELGGDGKTITKDQLTDYINKLESDDSSKDKGKLGFLKQLEQNFDKISNGNDSITATDLKNGMDLLKPPERNGEGTASHKIKSQWQDPSEITSSQLEYPIDIRV